MNMQQKIDTVYQWLKEGYTVHGVTSGEMWTDGKYKSFSGLFNPQPLAQSVFISRLSGH